MSASNSNTNFLAGVIEGFYGQPWSQADRFELFDRMGRWGLNTYLYAPKDDLKHRTLWREPYSIGEAELIKQVIADCSKHNIRFIYALSPGLDIRYNEESDLDILKKRFSQLMSLGCHDFALLFDDIPDRMEAGALKRWGSLASAQSHVANSMFMWTRKGCPEGRFLFCPTAYCGRMAERRLGGENYLQTLGKELVAGVDVFWTGPEIISREISVAHAEEIGALLRRKPLIWDNLHANDYDGRRFFCGPYAGRPPQLLNAVSGLMSNPNSEFRLNYVPLRTLAEFVHCGPTSQWDPRKAYLAAMKEWLPRFKTVRGDVILEALVLFGDCYYLPHEEGPEAELLYTRARDLVIRGPMESADESKRFKQQATCLREFCVQMTELEDRPLFYALSRRIWELREEMDLLIGYLDHKSLHRNSEAGCSSDFHLPGTYRGGMTARLQRLLEQRADGSFVAHIETKRQRKIRSKSMSANQKKEHKR